MSPEDIFAEPRRFAPTCCLAYATYHPEDGLFVHLDGTVRRIDARQAINMMEVFVRAIRDQVR